MKATTKMLCTVVLGGSAMLVSTHANAQAPKTLDMDKTFLAVASESDLAEIKQSQLALDKSSDPDIKAFAQKMIDDHTMLEQKMKPVADKDGVTPAMQLNSMHQAEYDKLSGLSGKDFDKEYMKSMSMDHAKALNDFKTEKATTKDPDLKMTLPEGEKVVAMHKKMADKLAHKVGAKVTPTDSSMAM